jgi:cell division protein FtsB
MLSTVQSRTFRHLVSCLKPYKLENAKLYFFLILYFSILLQQPYIQNNTRNNQQIAAQTRQTTRKSEKNQTRTHMKMEINRNATRTNTSK